MFLYGTNGKKINNTELCNLFHLVHSWWYIKINSETPHIQDLFLALYLYKQVAVVY
jgi:hypothetical protein